MAVGYVVFMKVEIVGGDCRCVWVSWKFRERSGRTNRTFYCSVVQHSQLITIQLYPKKGQHTGLSVWYIPRPCFAFEYKQVTTTSIEFPNTFNSTSAS
nr:hypothetical protein CFP56_24906 [Quercus suber]